MSVLAGLSLHGATVLWNEATNGTLDSYPYAPTNGTFVIHPVGTATDDVNYVQGTVTVSPLGAGSFEANYDAFFFTIPPNRQLTGLLLTYAIDFRGYAWGGFCASATGIYDGTADLGDWVAYQSSNDLFAILDLSALPPGDYSMDILPLLEDYTLQTNGTITYSLAILTAPNPPVLHITGDGSQIILNWSANNSAGFSLQCTTSLNPPVVWTAATNPPVQVNDQLVVTNTLECGTRFFRLLGPGP